MKNIKQKNPVGIYRIHPILMVALLVVILIFAYKFVLNTGSGNGTATLPTVNTNGCNRTTPYQMPPEFVRAISIIDQRSGMDTWTSFQHCLNIQYKDLRTEYPGSEGVFLFDKSISTPNNLKIYVDSAYQDYDDYLTAVLLIHEITHADQFYHNSSKSCMEKEVSAFFNEVALFMNFNEEERNSLFSRMQKPNSTSPIQSLDKLTDIAILGAVKPCKRQTELDKDCWRDKTHELIREMVTTSSYYQQQCRTD